MEVPNITKYCSDLEQSEKYRALSEDQTHYSLVIELSDYANHYTTISCLIPDFKLMTKFLFIHLSTDAWNVLNTIFSQTFMRSTLVRRMWRLVLLLNTILMLLCQQTLCIFSNICHTLSCHCKHSLCKTDGGRDPSQTQEHKTITKAEVEKI